MTGFKKGNIPWNKGKKLSKELRKRFSEAGKLYYQTPTHHALGTKIDRDIVEKARESRLQYYRTHDVWNKNKKHTKATRNRISQAIKEFWTKRKKKDKTT